MKGLASVLVTAAAAFAAIWSASAEPYVLPDDEPHLAQDSAGSRLVQEQCATCHSLDYVLTQPRGKGRPFWEGEVTKMRNAYGAPVSQADADAIAAYLERN